MLIDIDEETVDKIFQQTLLQDYRGLLKQKQNLIDRLESLEMFELEDLTDTKRWIEGIETMMEYYIGHNWQEKV